MINRAASIVKIGFSNFWPKKSTVKSCFLTLAMVLIGGLILSPLVHQLPMVGWDWFYFFSCHNPSFNLLSSTSAYPPFAKYFIQILTWMNWRDSLALLNSFTLVTIALATWQSGGKYGSILMALISPCVWMLLYIGHPDGLALLGVITGLIPLALIKPQLTIWTMFVSHKSIFWAVLFLLITLILWPLWPFRLRMATLTHEAAFGWVVTGWPVAIIGLILFIGAGNDPYRLIAAGLLMSPYLMPYNLAILTPSIGKAKGTKKALIWASSWLVVVGVGLGGSWRYLNLIFPITAYCLTHSLVDYKNNLHNLVTTFYRYRNKIRAASASPR